jgi:fatty-acyl-CoA synthase
MTPVPRDGKTIGEIMARGSTIMKGYLKDEEATRVAFAGGWFHTGDLGVIHPDGYMEVKDRSKDIIISGGENISSIEIESVLFQHPGVLEAAVVARPDPQWGESPCAFVTLRDGARVSADDLVAYCRKCLPRFYVPKRIVFGVLPKTSTGKVLKFKLREIAKTTSRL